ncbi:unnamed protein product [Scytosiphon promiscuus]
MAPTPLGHQGCGGWRHCLETQSGTKAPLLWFETWNATIQPKMDRLLETSRMQQEGWSKENGLLLVFSGDSTIIQQFQVLSEFVTLRSDFHPVTGADAERLQKYELTFGGPRSTPGTVTLVFYRVFETCVLAKENPHVQRAYAMYFGCGMHLLHLIPVQSPSLLQQALQRRGWAGYETLLTQRIEGWRQANPDIRLIFMSTHAIDESKYFGDWLHALEGYKARNPVFLDSCKAKFDQALPADSPLRANLEQACVDTVFGERGVELLNARALTVMGKKGVALVPAHSVVAGQQWATPAADGRHYPYLVPLELFWLFNTLESLP